MSNASTTIASVTVTPIAFPDPPLLNAAGVHEPLALRCIVQVRTQDGLVGVGEAHGGAALLSAIERAAQVVVGLRGDAINAARERIHRELADFARRDAAFSPIEVAMLDLTGKRLRVPVVTLLGGAVRDRAEFSGYLFYKWDRHLDEPDADAFGRVLNGDELIESARRFADEFGFRSWKVKGGVWPPALEVADVTRLREAFPDSAVRLDPNARWTLAASVRAAEELQGVVEYLEDPCAGLATTAELRRRVDLPLATNMLNESVASHVPLLSSGAVDVVLLDHHVVGGLSRAAALGQLCAEVGLATSMHSNSHLGISLAAMTHLTAAVTGDVRASDTHYPWNRKYDVIVGGPLPIVDGCVTVPDAPGLGVELDADLLAEAHERFLATDIRERGDAAYMRRVHPDFDNARGQWEYQ